jgi:hypothetical protein
LIIYLFNLLKDKEKYDLKKDFIQINQKKITLLHIIKIIRLERCFNPNNKEKNYILIGSSESNLEIGVTHDYKNIEEIQKIDSKY